MSSVCMYGLYSVSQGWTNPLEARPSLGTDQSSSVNINDRFDAVPLRLPRMTSSLNLHLKG